MSLWSLARAALRRDFALARSYRLPYVMDLANTLFNLTLLFGIAGLVARPHGAGASMPGGYLGFAVLGIILLRLAQSGLYAQGARLRSEQTTGTLEALLGGPSPAWKLVLAGSSYDMAQAGVSSVLTLALAMAVFGVRLSAGGIEAAIAIAAFLAATGFVVALGLALSAFTLVFKQAGAAIALGVAALSVLSGVYFPLSVLPAPVRIVGHAIPFTWGLEVLRAALLSGQARWGLLGALVGVDVVGLAVAVRLVDAAVRRCRRTGALGLY